MKREDFITIERDNGIATLWIDHQKEKMNIVSPPLFEIFESVFEEIESDNEVKAVVIISRKKDFIAGADVRSFAIEKSGDFRPFQEKGHRSLARLEAGKKPVVAAVHGTCVGLGTEIALACHAIIASDSPTTRFALPEVRLGILPGGGGTQRLPRRIGIQEALPMMLTGKNIYAYRAKKIGLVDELTDQHKLHQAALIIARRLLEGKPQRKRRRGMRGWLLEGNPLGRSIVFSQARKQALKQSQGNYPAIPAIIECVERGYKNGIADGYQAELDHFERLILTPESKAMRTLFFRMTAAKKNPVKAKARALNKLGMIGAGFMGAGICEISVNNGIDVMLKDISPDVIATARQSISKELQKKVRYRTLTKTAAEEISGRIRGQLDYDNFSQADIVIEAVLEKMQLKKQIIAEVEAISRPELIFATNTSSLSVTEMAAHATRPEQVIGMHYFSPVPKMPLLEIVTTEKTADWVVASCFDFGTRQGKTCIIVKDGPGFYVNRILAPYINECLTMVEEGVAFDVVDRQLKRKGFPVGPITLIDEVGIDIVAHTTRTSSEVVKGREGFEINEAVLKMFDAGRRGRKNRQGFYLYDKNSGKRKAPDRSAYQFFAGKGEKTLDSKDIQDRALMLMINEAVLCLEQGIIANPVDGDLAAVLGMGFLPFSGGPFSYMDQLGLAAIANRMKALEQAFGARFQPAQSILDKAAKGSTFH